VSILSAKERGDMAEELLPQAANLVALVHGDGGPRDIHQALARLSPAQKEAMLVILAGMVDPDQPLSRALGWVEFDEHGRTVVPPAWDEQATVRDLAPEPELETEDTYVDEVAVQAYLAGKPVSVTKRERLAAVAAGVRRGMSYLEFDRMHGLSKDSTCTFVTRERQRYAARGEVFPIPPQPGKSTPHLSDEQVVAIRKRYAQGGITELELAMQHGVSRNVISSLLTGKSYRNAGGPLRAKKANRPGENTRTMWARGRAGYGVDAKEKVA
jgi:hypothetical protein